MSRHRGRRGRCRREPRGARQRAGNRGRRRLETRSGSDPCPTTARWRFTISPAASLGGADLQGLDLRHPHHGPSIDGGFIGPVRGRRGPTIPSFAASVNRAVQISIESDVSHTRWQPGSSPPAPPGASPSRPLPPGSTDLCRSTQGFNTSAPATTTFTVKRDDHAEDNLGDALHGRPRRASGSARRCRTDTAAPADLHAETHTTSAIRPGSRRRSAASRAAGRGRCPGAKEHGVLRRARAGSAEDLSRVLGLERARERSTTRPPVMPAGDPDGERTKRMIGLHQGGRRHEVRPALSTQFYETVGGPERVSFQNPCERLRWRLVSTTRPDSRQPVRARARAGGSACRRPLRRHRLHSMPSFVIAQPSEGTTRPGFNAGARILHMARLTPSRASTRACRPASRSRTCPYVLNSGTGMRQNSVNTGFLTGRLDGFTIVLGHEGRGDDHRPRRRRRHRRAEPRRLVRRQRLGKTATKCAWVDTRKASTLHRRPSPAASTTSPGTTASRYAVQASGATTPQAEPVTAPAGATTYPSPANECGPRWARRAGPTARSRRRAAIISIGMIEVATPHGLAHAHLRPDGW